MTSINDILKVRDFYKVEQFFRVYNIKMWPDWHDVYDFDEFSILKFVPEEPGVFIIRRKFQKDLIVLIDAAENLKEKLLDCLVNPPDELAKHIYKGEILEFAFLRTLDPYTVKDGILEDFKHLRNS